MKRIGLIGLGNMGIGMARNLVSGGYEVVGFDLRSERRTMLQKIGGTAADDVSGVGQAADFVFIMVLTGGQAHEVVTADQGLLQTMRPGATLAVSATIEPHVMQEIAAAAAGAGVRVIDCPVSGGKAGAEDGTLTFMVASERQVYEEHRDVLGCVGSEIYHVGEKPGMGQTIKAALQALIGTTFAGVFEAMVLGSKAGISGRALYDVFTASGVRSPLLQTCMQHILDRQFTDTGSHIGTMYKDLGITMGLAHQTGTAMFATSAAYEIFQSGISLFPEEDNWACVKLLEQIASTQATW